MAEYPKWKQDACEGCRKGLGSYLYVNGGIYHSLTDYNAADPQSPCTAPTEAQYIEQLTARVTELERDNAGLRQPPDNEAWRLVVEYAYKVGGEGVRHINSITSHYLAMRDRSAGLEAECSAVGLANTNLQADNARLRTALEDVRSAARNPWKWDRAYTGHPEDLTGRSVGLVIADNLNLIVDKALSSAPVAAEVAGMYYIQNKGYVGNCLLWWKNDGSGYTCDLSEAWLVTEEKAKDICRSRPEEDIPHPVEFVNSVAAQHVSCEQFRLALAAQEALKTEGK